MDSARFELSKSVCWERNSRPKLSKKSFEVVDFRHVRAASRPNHTAQRSFSFLFYARCHSDYVSQAMLDACVRAFANVLSMSVTLSSGILLKCFEVFKLPFVRQSWSESSWIWPLFGSVCRAERRCRKLWLRSRKTEFVRIFSILCAWFAWRDVYGKQWTINR